MRTARRVIVTGRVQGVFYRAWTRDEARRLGVDGWVRNRADGSVEALIEGDEQAVEALIAVMRHGPSGAMVAELRQSPSEATGGHGFEVRH